MLSKEDSRRLAQLERQLRRDDPDFCARMGGGNYSVPTRKRLPFLLIFTTLVVAVTAMIFGLLGWWVATVATGLWALACLAGVAYRIRRNRQP